MSYLSQKASWSCILLAFLLFPKNAIAESHAIGHKADTTSLRSELIQLYQREIGDNTIHRCPFKTSCSSFLEESVTKYGRLKGFALFIDRYFYRENIAIKKQYNSIISGNRVLYDDAIPDSLIYYLYSK